MDRSRQLSLSLVALTALALAACGGGSASPSEAASAAAPESVAASAVASDAAPPSAAASPSAAAEGESLRVRLEGFAFDPEELTISAGTEVTFLNADSAPHTVTEGVDGVAAEGAFVDEELAGNQATRVLFDEPGTYQITCRFHPSMNMTVIVEG